jgi:hypothetical protein
MGLFGFLSPSSPNAASFKGVAAQYRRLRPVRLRLNNELVGRLSRDAFNEGASKLGMLRGKTFFFENEDETSVMMDYCIYNVYHKGRNAVEQYLCDSPPDPDSDEMACLRAMQQATYSLVVVLRVEPGIGCHVRNLFTEETRLLTDFGFAATAQPGALMATRLLDFGDFVTTSGAALPLGILDENGLDEWQRELNQGTNEDRFDPAPLIRSCLRAGASSRVRYESPGENRRFDVGDDSPSAGISVQPRRAPAKRPAGKPAGNRRCRCGSGKMFKNCCGKRQSQLRNGD